MRLAPPRFLAFVLTVLALVALVAFPRRAYAQPAVTGLTSVTRVLSDGKTSANNEYPHAGGVPANAINYQDCVADLAYQFVLTISSPTTADQLVAYAGSNVDCTVTANRTADTAACYPVIPQPVLLSVTTATLNVRMQDIAVQAPYTATDPTYTAANGSACTVQPSSTPSSVAIYFFFVDAYGNPVGVAQAYPVTVATQAPVVNGSISAASDTNSLDISIPATSDSNVTGWNLYCDPPPGQETTLNQIPYDAASNAGLCYVDSGDNQVTVGEDAGDDGGDASSDAGDASDGIYLNDGGLIPATGGCYPSAVFASSVTTIAASTEEGGAASTSGGLPQTLISLKYICGYAGPSDTTATITGLKNGYNYNVAVGATDAYGNVGPLATACGTPGSPIDFFSRYADAGGLAGGGYCATDGAGVPVGTGALFLLVIAAGAALVRRRMRA
jgi:hypothetical protein